MSKVDDIRLDTSVAAVLGVAGVLTFDTADAALRQIRAALLNSGQISQLDLAGVGHSDSAGLACIVTVLAEADRAGKALHVTHMPAGLKALAQVCEVDQLLA